LTKYPPYDRFILKRGTEQEFMMKYPILSRLFSGKKDEIELAEPKTEDVCQLVAVIAAALQEYMKKDAGVRLEIASIKRTGQSVPLWSRVGRLERISGKL
jgi:hypothetical protein